MFVKYSRKCSNRCHLKAILCKNWCFFCYLELLHDSRHCHNVIDRCTLALINELKHFHLANMASKAVMHEVQWYCFYNQRNKEDERFSWQTARVLARLHALLSSVRRGPVRSRRASKSFKNSFARDLQSSVGLSFPPVCRGRITTSYVSWVTVMRPCISLLISVYISVFYALLTGYEVLIPTTTSLPSPRECKPLAQIPLLEALLMSP